MMKTPITVLQELMIKNNKIPEYECMSQSGPQHQATFEYRCLAEGIVVIGQARSKKEAKQEAARKMLQQLYVLGHPVPAPYDTEPEYRVSPPPSPTNNPALEGVSGSSRGAGGGLLDIRSYVALLRELCEEYRLGEAEYELVGDTGPPHLRHFTVVVTLGQHVRSATTTTKKAARQMAAEQLYTYLRENLARLTKDFSEEQALLRAQEKSRQRARTEAALARYAAAVEPEGEAAAAEADGEAEAEGEPAPWRPDLGQRVAQYHLGLRQHLGDETCKRGLEAMKDGIDAEIQLEEVCAAMGLRVEYESLCPVPVVVITPTAPRLAFAGTTRADAARAALRYMRRGLLPTTSLAQG